MNLRWQGWLLMVAVGCFPAAAAAEQPNRASAWRAPWTTGYPQVEADVTSGQPLTVLVVVALCDNQLIDCGGQGAGDPGSLERNLYWGRGFGARRYFDEIARGWERVAREPGSGGAMLEQVVYRRFVAASRWNGAQAHPGKPVEQLMVLRAIHGRQIDQAVLDLYRFASGGERATFRDGEQLRQVNVHVVGYAGHNRLMDGVTLAPPKTGGTPLPSFVFACRSQAYFSDTLSDLGSQPLVMTRDLMAPEGYVIEATARALGDHVSAGELRERVVRSYARWQRLSERTARTIFSR